MVSVLGFGGLGLVRVQGLWGSDVEGVCSNFLKP